MGERQTEAILPINGLANFGSLRIAIWRYCVSYTQQLQSTRKLGSRVLISGIGSIHRSDIFFLQFSYVTGTWYQNFLTVPGWRSGTPNWRHRPRVVSVIVSTQADWPLAEGFGSSCGVRSIMHWNLMSCLFLCLEEFQSC